MADNSVGMISLDLVIREKLGEQLEKIKARISAPAESIGASMAEAMEKPMKSAGKAVADSIGKALETAEKFMDNGIDEVVKCEVKRLEEQQKALEESLSKASKPRVVPMGRFITYDSSKITQEIDDLNKQIEESSKKAKEKMSEPLSNTLDEVKSKLENFKVDAEPTARLQQETELLTEKLGLLQKRYQELSAADPSDKVSGQLNNVKRQIVSAQGQLDKLNAKWKESKNAGKPGMYDIVREKFCVNSGTEEFVIPT